MRYIMHLSLTARMRRELYVTPSPGSSVVRTIDNGRAAEQKSKNLCPVIAYITQGRQRIVTAERTKRTVYRPFVRPLVATIYNGLWPEQFRKIILAADGIADTIYEPSGMFSGGIVPGSVRYISEGITMETNERNPLQWSDATAAAMLRIVAAYVRKWSGDDSPTTLSPDERDETRSRIIMDIMTGTVPDGITPLHYVFKVCRRWRVRGWNGDTETDRIRKRAERAAVRKSLRDPGSRESEEGRNKSPFRGVSDDARQPRPDRILEAIETATMEGLRYVSDRQRKARRRPVKGKPERTRYRVAIVGRIGRPMAGYAPNGRTLWWPGSGTRIAFEPLPPTREVGPRGRPHVPYVGTVGHRAIGKAKTAAVGEDAIGTAAATMAILGRTERRRFIPTPPPTRGIPAMAGDGSAIRTAKG